MSNPQLLDTNKYNYKDTSLSIIYSPNVVKRRELCMLTAITEVYGKEVSSFNSVNNVNGLKLMKSLNTTIPFESHYIHSATLAESEITPLEIHFERDSTTLVSFFALQMIDIPKSFSRSKSLYSPNASIHKLRLTNMLMRHGRKAKVSIALSRSIHEIINNYVLPINKTNLNFDQISSKKSINADPSKVSSEARLTTAPFIKNAHNSKGDVDWLQNLIFEELEKYTPLFSFYVKKVDKLKRKHSRGKSGKYSIVWKYVPKYRRLTTTLRWLIRDIRFQKAKTFNLRLTRSLELFVFDRSSHLVPQLRQFVHTFVFKHHKKTLIKTLKSVS